MHLQTILFLFFNFFFSVGGKSLTRNSNSSVLNSGEKHLYFYYFFLNETRKYLQNYWDSSGTSKKIGRDFSLSIFFCVLGNNLPVLHTRLQKNWNTWCNIWCTLIFSILYGVFFFSIRSIVLVFFSYLLAVECALALKKLIIK